jgi:hypothetical protein
MRKLLLALLLVAPAALGQYGPSGNPSTKAGVGFQPLAKTAALSASTTSANIALAASATVSGVAITGTAGQFSCTCSYLSVGMSMTISGTYGGTGSIVGYANPTIYTVSAVGTGTFSLSNPNGSAIVTTAGTPTGLTYSATAIVAPEQVQIFNNGTAAAFVLFCATSSCTASVGSAGTSTSDYPVAPGAVVVVTVPSGTNYAAAVLAASTATVYFSPGIGL